MKISEFTKTEDLQEQVKALTTEREGRADIKELKEEWEVSQHKVMKTEYLPDKQIKNKEGQVTGIKKVNRISAPFQKKIVNTAVVFGFGNEVELVKSHFKENSDEEKVFNAVKKILDDNKAATFNRKVARECYRATEVAEVWYYEKTETHEEYGFPCDYKIRVKLLTPWNGENLYPHFDSYDKLRAFVRAFSVGKQEYLDVYTSSEYQRYKKTNGIWEKDQITDGDNEIPVYLDLSQTIGKIPVIYASQENAEWRDVQSDIERLELLFSRHAEINDYHAAPKIFIEGELMSTPQAGEANGVIQGSIGTKAHILSWDHSPESIKLEIATRLSNIFKFTQTPDVSFESVKALNQISGVMLKMLFMDAHLKVLEKEEIWDEYYERRFNLLKTYVGKLLNPSLEKASKSLSIKPKFNPYMIDDLKSKIEMLMTANGNKPIVSHQGSVVLGNLAEDIQEEWKIIKTESEEEKQKDIFQSIKL
ncbi:phage portal protein [Riemerella anatipestifer]|uniref:Phage portal protein n=1 Tax=Riemerella anatipestifer TaxID=34085 RepID=A0A1S7DQF5_RIEAN|nr:phage portal protein [Riemerella anatipestifer]AQY21349.1 hypothetical protein AB406_0390 [Riemerella anatipestifer]